MHKLSENVSGKLICVLVVLTRVLNWLQFGVVSDFSGHLCWPLACWRSVLFTDDYRVQLYLAVWRVLGAPWWRWGNGMAGISYGQGTQLHLINGNLIARRYRDKILRPIAVPFIRRHYIVFQHDNARPHIKKDLYTTPGSWKCPSSSMACILTRHATHWACLGCSGLEVD